LRSHQCIAPEKRLDAGQRLVGAGLDHRGGDEGGGGQVGQVFVIEIARFDESRADRDLVRDGALAVAAESRAARAVERQCGGIESLAL
jgi:hypothetical protein